MPMQSKPIPEEFAAMLQARDGISPPQLPASWTAAGLFFPFGDANSPMGEKYDQLVIANVAYDSTGPQPAMRVSLYLLEDLQYFDFLFIGKQWYWLRTPTGQRPNSYWGPFDSTSLHVPQPDFLAKARDAGAWNVSGISAKAWVIPTTTSPPAPHGTWYWTNSFTGALWRVLNLDTDNPVGIPILGSYYLAYLPGFRATGPLNLPGLIQGIPRIRGDAPSPMVSQRDIQDAIANPLARASCTLADIQAVIPGISHPSVQPPKDSLPQWTDKTYILGATIGCDFIPYATEVWYWWGYKRQRTSFLGYNAAAPGHGTYDMRSDDVLYRDYFTQPFY